MQGRRPCIWTLAACRSEYWFNLVERSFRSMRMFKLFRNREEFL